MADEKIYIDFDEGVKRVMNNTKLYVKLLTKFRTDTNTDALSAALAAGELSTAQSHAHTIKGIAANLSLMELYNQVLELENQIKANAVDPNQIEIVLNVFNETIKEADKAIADNG